MGSHAEVKHEYHLVDPSPWPLMAAVSLFLITFGVALDINDVAVGGWLWPVGAAALFYTVYVWWRDVVREARAGHHTPIVGLHLRYGMVLFIASEVMFFVAWFWAYFNASVYPTEAMGGVWPPVGVQTFDPWHLPLINTIILLTSGATVTWAHHALQHGDRKGTRNGLIVTILLGLTFTCVQAYEYAHAGFGFAGDLYGTTFFMATGFHGFHVIVGTIFLSVCLLRVVKGQMTPKQHFGFEAAAWYWHFVDVVWLFLFSVIYVMGQGTPVAH